MPSYPFSKTLIMRPIVCLIVAASLFITTSYAQAGSASEAVAIPLATPTHDWAALQTIYASRDIKVFIFAQFRLGKPQSCHIRTITANSIVCRSLGRQKIFAKDDINVIDIENPAERTVRTVAWSFLGASGASAYGAYALSSVLVASIPLAILAFALVCTLGAIGVGDNNESITIYERP